MIIIIIIKLTPVRSHKLYMINAVVNGILKTVNAWAILQEALTKANPDYV